MRRRRHRRIMIDGVRYRLLRVDHALDMLYVYRWNDVVAKPVTLEHVRSFAAGWFM